MAATIKLRTRRGTATGSVKEIETSAPLGVVLHGADEDKARPKGYDSVLWLGNAEPEELGPKDFRLDPAALASLDGVASLADAIASGSLQIGPEAALGVNGTISEFVFPSLESNGARHSLVIESGVFNDAAGTYRDNVMRLGWNTGPDAAAGETRAGFQLESKFRQTGADPFLTEYIFLWQSADGLINRRPYQSSVQHAAGNGRAAGFVDHTFSGEVNFQSSASENNAIWRDNGDVLMQRGALTHNSNNAAWLRQMNAAGTSSVTLLYLDEANLVRMPTTVRADAGILASVVKGIAGGELVLGEPSASVTVAAANFFAKSVYIANGYTLQYSGVGYVRAAGVLNLQDTAEGPVVVGTAGLQVAGAMRFGTHSAVGAEAITGYITITDAGGATRKLAVIS